MQRLRWTTFVLGGLMALLMGTGMSLKAAAQPVDPLSSASYTAGNAATLFATVEGQEDAFDGFLVQVPPGWSLQEAVVLRYGSEPVPVQVRAVDDRAETYLIAADQPLRSPHEIVLRTDVGRITGTATWSIVPYSRAKDGRDVARETYRQTRQVRVNAAPAASSAANQALTFADAASGPLLLRPDALPAVNASASFTVEFWLKTTGLDEAVLSTWTGEEQVAYPMEVVIDVSGRLRYFWGQQGRHQSLVTPDPIADGRWHHVALVYEADQSRLRLLLNGARVDSLRNVRVPSPARPAPMAIGGRVDAPANSSSEEAAPIADFSGWLDEVRMWSEARPEADIRRLARRTLGTTASGGTGRLVMSFEAPVPERILAERTPSGTRRPADLIFREPVSNLRATVQQQRVQLAWTAPSSELDAFIIERSTDGQRFTAVERVAPMTIAAEETQDGTRYTYTDDAVSESVVYYRVRQQFTDGAERLSGILKVGLGGGEPSAVQLIGNFPNPFSESTTIAFEVRERQEINLSVWDLSGHRLAQLVNETKAPGYYEMPFQASNLPSGTYFVRLQTPGQTASHKMILLK